MLKCEIYHFIDFHFIDFLSFYHFIDFFFFGQNLHYLNCKVVYIVVHTYSSIIISEFSENDLNC